MANNSFLPVVPGPVSAGAVESFANEDIGGIKYPNIRVLWGAAGVATPTSAANPLPVTQTGTATVSGTVAATQSGAWNINAITTLPAITGSVTLSGNNNMVRLNDKNGFGLTSQTRGTEQPLSVQIVDAAGAQITSFGGGSGGATVTEDVAALSDPQGNQIMARRRDTLVTSEVSADGDQIALNANNKGQLHVLAEIPASQLGSPGPQTKAASTSVTRASDEYTKGTSLAQLVGTGETTIVPAVSGKRRNLYGLILSNTNATTASLVTIRDSTGSVSAIFMLLIPPNDMRGFTLDCGSAVNQTTINANWTGTNSAAVTVDVTALWVEE